MYKLIEKLLLSQGITLFAPIKLESEQIFRAYKLEKGGLNPQKPLFAVILAVPYLTEQKKPNISAYAVPRDYHLFFKDLFSELLPRLEASFPNNHFCGFADDSPIDERTVAAMAGLGMLGKNGTLITERYSSYVFLGEVITDLPIAEVKTYPITHCENCGACTAVCPKGAIGVCLSALTQKKGILTEEEQQAIIQYGSAWGCDRCQEVCPHTKQAIENRTIYTEIPFFKSNLIPNLSSKLIENMSEAEFSARAYSWRKKETVLRNLFLLETQQKQGKET